MIRRALWGLLAMAWMGFLFWLSAQPDLPHAPEPWLDMVVKKSGHAVLYGVLAWLYLGVLRGDGPPSDRTRLLAAGLAILYAVTDEIHQSFVPGRTPSPWDVVIDGIGAALAVGVGGKRQSHPLNSCSLPPEKPPTDPGPGRAQPPEPAQ